MTSRRLDTGTLHGTYGKRQLLQAIYTVYVDWRDDGCSDQAWDELANRLPDDTIDPSEHLLGLLIRVALPEVRKNVVAIWVDAILYGEAHHIRPHKLRSFFHVKEGLVRCAQLQRQSRSGRPLKKRR